MSAPLWNAVMVCRAVYGARSKALSSGYGTRCRTLLKADKARYDSGAAAVAAQEKRNG
jgi:hypothetical protein